MSKKGLKGINLLEWQNALAMSDNFTISRPSQYVAKERCQCGKISYNSEAEATKMIKALRNKERGQKKYVYKCSQSSKFHIATK